MVDKYLTTLRNRKFAEGDTEPTFRKIGFEPTLIRNLGFHDDTDKTGISVQGPLSLKTGEIISSGFSGHMGSVSVSGSEGGYAGIYFADVERYLLVNQLFQGFAAGGSWQWGFNDGTLAYGTVPWARLSGIPSTFAPSTHSHAWSEVTNKPTVFDSNAIQIPDTRNVVSVPENLPEKSVSAEFKFNTSVGNPPVTASAQYSHIINVAGWSSGEGSGGWPSQISVGAGGLAVRQATSATTWGSWKDISKPSWSQLSGGSTGVIPTSGSSGTWTSVNMSGSKGGYAGIYFTDYARYLMVNASLQGFHTGSAWQWYFNNGTLESGTVPWARLSGVPRIVKATWGSAPGSPAAGDMYFTA